MEFLDWITWFALVPAGGMVVFGGLVFLWAHTVLLTRRRVWLVTLALSLVFLVVEYVLIFKFAYLIPD
jgi:hypothetical protein